MALVDSLVVFLVGLAVGGLGIHTGAMLVIGSSDYLDAVFTALIGAIVWAIVSFFLGWIPLLGPILVLLSWLWVVKSRYQVGWISGAGIAIVAWVWVIAVLYLLSVFGFSNPEVLGIPGV